MSVVNAAAMFAAKRISASLNSLLFCFEQARALHRELNEVKRIMQREKQEVRRPRLVYSAPYQWHPVPGFDGYELNASGAIRSVDRTDAAGRQVKGRILKPAMVRGKHASVCLYRDKKQYRRAVRALICEAFAREQRNIRHGE